MHGLAGIRRDGCNVDKADDALVDASARDGGTAIGMADQNDGTANAVEGALDRREVFLVAVQSVLDRDHLMAVGLQRRDHLAETRAVRPDAMAEHDRRLGRGRHCLLLDRFDGGASAGPFSPSTAAVRITPRLVQPACRPPGSGGERKRQVPLAREAARQGMHAYVLQPFADGV